MPSLKPTFGELSFFDGRDTNNAPRYLRSFTEDEWEILFEPDYSQDPFLQEWKKDLAERLFATYQDKPNTGDNIGKIQKFNDVLFPPPKPKEEVEDERPLSERIEQYFKELSLWVSGLTWKKTKEWVRSFDTAKVIITLQIWFTAFRLFLLRSNRMSILTGLASATEPPFSMYVYLIRIGGLSYLLSLIADIGIIIYETFFRKRSARERCLPLWKCLWERFKAVMLEEARIYRMLNDAVWVAINATGIFLTGGLLIPVNAAVNVAGFAFDVVNEFVVGVYRYYKIEVPEGKVESLLKEQKVHLENYHKPRSELPNGYQKLSKQDYEKLSFDHQKLQVIKDKLQEKRMEILFDRLRIVLCLAIVVVGMVLVFYPPTTFAGAAILGATFALIFGSMTTGLGPRLYRAGKEWIPRLYQAAKDKINKLVDKLSKPFANTNVNASPKTDSHDQKKDNQTVEEELKCLTKTSNTIVQPQPQTQTQPPHSEQKSKLKPRLRKSDEDKFKDEVNENENGKNQGYDTTKIYIDLSLAVAGRDATTTIIVTNEEGRQMKTEESPEEIESRPRSKSKESALSMLNISNKSPRSLSSSGSSGDHSPRDITQRITNSMYIKPNSLPHST